MSNEEKLKAIADRLSQLKVEIDSDMITCLVISNYFNEFQKKGLIDGELVMTPNGLTVVSVVNEFDLKPTNEEIKEYVDGLISSDNNEQLIKMLIEYRDNPIEFMEKIDSSE